MSQAEISQSDSTQVRGRLAEALIGFLKQIWDETNTYGFLIALGILFVALFILISMVFERAGNAFGQGTVNFIGFLFALAYTTWIGWSSYREYKSLDRARKISDRPSIDTVLEAIQLLKSSDSETRENASSTISEIVSLGPQKVVHETGVDAEELVDYMIPLLDAPSDTTRENIANAVRLFARDYYESVAPHRDILLAAVKDEQRGTAVRADLALSIGYLALSTDRDMNDIESTATELVDEPEPKLRVGACYMLAGVGSKTAQRKLRQVAEEDPDPDVRAHAEGLI